MKVAKKAGVKPYAKEMAEEKKWRAQSDMDTVMRAQEIMADRSRMAQVKRLAAKQVQIASKIAKK
jgi:hypothetical protein